MVFAGFTRSCLTGTADCFNHLPHAMPARKPAYHETATDRLHLYDPIVQRLRRLRIAARRGLSFAGKTPF